jgi:choline-sulfatase
MTPANLLFILSDQHSRDAAGCYGHPQVQTPNLDRLAGAGTRFTSAYTNCPICVPARASLATGRYVHQLGSWDNAFPYHGEVPSWGHRLKQAGTCVDSIGKLHFRSSDDDNGFTREIDPLHVVDGEGDLLCCLREDAPVRDKRPGIESAGPGDSTYLQYDASNADRACQWIAAHREDSQPWVLFLSFVCPHPPYISPPELFERYPRDQVMLPPQWRQEDWPRHAAVEEFRRSLNHQQPFDEGIIRNMIAAYWGACSFLDRQIGRVLDALEAASVSDATRVIYTSDHGESAGARGLFGKHTMYDESAAVPLLIAGPDVPRDRVVTTPVSLLDCFPTVLQGLGAAPDSSDRDLPGRSLWEIAAAENEDRTVFSEYHAVGSRRAAYMLRDERYKFVFHVAAPPQLFDITSDPGECSDLVVSGGHDELIAKFEGRLRSLLDPEETDARARQSQREKVEAFGGREEVLRRGTFDNSPVPGETPAFQKFQ